MSTLHPDHEVSQRTLQWVKRQVGGKIEVFDGMPYLLRGDAIVIRFLDKGKLRVFRDGKPSLDFWDTKLLVEYFQGETNDQN